MTTGKTTLLKLDREPPELMRGPKQDSFKGSFKDLGFRVRIRGYWSLRCVASLS